MPAVLQVLRSRRPSRLALIGLAGCIAGVLVLAVADGYIQGVAPLDTAPTRVWAVVVRHLLSLLEQGMLVAAAFWIGAVLTESRTVLSVGFDRLDAPHILVDGPDDGNVVWVGRRYRVRLEAEAVAAAMQERLRQSS